MLNYIYWVVTLLKRMIVQFKPCNATKSRFKFQNQTTKRFFIEFFTKFVVFMLFVIIAILELVSAIFYQFFFFFHQMKALQKLWKMFFISSKKLFLFLRYSHFCIFSLPFHTFQTLKNKWKCNNLWCHELACINL